MKNITRKEKILDSACEIFTVKGYHGTSTTEIAKHAGVSQGLLFHYFGDKENIWNMVNQKVMQSNKWDDTGILKLDQNFKEFLGNLIIKGSSLSLKNPEAMRVFTWNHLEFASQQQDEQFFAAEMQECQKIFASYQEQGQVTKDLKPEFMVRFVFSLTHPLVLNQARVTHEDSDCTSYLNFCVDSVKKAFASNVINPESL